MFELLDRDAAGRLCSLTIGKNKIKTPEIAVVVNPNIKSLKIEDIIATKPNLLITNAYIINRNPQTLSDIKNSGGLHNYFKWQNLIYTDSGTFQQFSHGKESSDWGPETTLKAQMDLGSDIITPLDRFVLLTDTKAEAKRKVLETAKRLGEARKTIKERFLVGPIQGGGFMDLRKLSCKLTVKEQPDLFAIGGIVPLMEQYRFAELANIIITCKQNIPAGKPVHAFGAGHPMLFSLLAAIGCDLFDSAMYSLAARRSAFLTVSGTLPVSELSELPCSCKACSGTTAAELKSMEKQDLENLLALHNLNITLAEIKTVREAIRGKWLWELVQQRCRSHPALLEALRFVLKTYGKWLLQQEPVSKKSAFQWLGEESDWRPEVLRAQEWLRRVHVKHSFTKPPFGKIPAGLKTVYPFGQSLIPGFSEPKVKTKPNDVLSATLNYQFGSGSDKRFKKAEIEVSRKTNRLRRIWSGKTLLGTIRPSDGFFIPSIAGAELLKGKIKSYEVKDKEVAELIASGKDLISKFAIPKGKISAGEQISVKYKGSTIAVGEALLTSSEVGEFKRGIAANLRNSTKNTGF